MEFKVKTLILCALLLSGCATTGIEMTDDEAAVCKVEGCSVWTVRELEGFARRFWGEGYRAGVKSI